MDFVITGLRVPDIDPSTQNIQVLRFNGAVVPPQFSASTTAHQSLFYTNSGSSGNDFVAVSIPITNGDVIGILGARGTSTMHNAYSGLSGSHTTAIGGSAVILARLLYQANLSSTPAGSVSGAGGSFSIVEMTYEVDADGDTYLSDVDCDDNDPAVFPSNVEICDGQDLSLIHI